MAVFFLWYSDIRYTELVPTKKPAPAPRSPPARPPLLAPDKVPRCNKNTRIVDQSDRISGNLGMVHNQIWDSQKLYENDDVSILNNEEHDASIKNLQKGSV